MRPATIITGGGRKLRVDDWAAWAARYLVSVRRALASCQPVEVMCCWSTGATAMLASASVLITGIPQRLQCPSRRYAPPAVIYPPCSPLLGAMSLSMGTPPSMRPSVATCGDMTCNVSRSTSTLRAGRSH